MGAIITVDAFWGDGGKGKLCAYISKEYDAKYIVRAGTGPNAGHSYFYNGTFIHSRMVPTGCITGDFRGIISSGVAVDPQIFLAEIEKYSLDGKVFVDWRCPIIEHDHISAEQSDEKMIKIDSTKSGTGFARADFIMRKGKQAKDIEGLSTYLVDGIEEINKSARDSVIVIEGSQATFLSLYASDRYPYVTSDNCTTAAFLDDASLNWQYIDKVILIVKCLPTCVGNGPLPFELSTSEISSRQLEEYGVNTGRSKRRSGQIDWDRLEYAANVNGPTEVALTFCDQYSPEMKSAVSKDKVTEKIKKLVVKIEKITGAPVTYLSTGNELSHMIKL